jgi:acyl carrier protein
LEAFILPVSIASRVIAVIARVQHLEVEKITAEQSFSDLGLDSLDGLRITFELEEEFDIAIPDDEAKGYVTVAQAIEGVTKLVERKVTAPIPTSG